MSQRNILIIEDEPDILELIEYNLKREGYRVTSSSDGEEGLDRARNEPIDLVLLDLMLPGLDGLEICRRMKADSLTSAIPIIMVTAKGEESDVVLGLGLGADDYVTKPFSPRELAARVRAVLRRASPRQERLPGERIVLKDLVIDAGKFQVRIADRPIEFTATEFRLLHFLASHPGRAFARQQLLNRVIGEEAVVIDRNIDVHIRAIRKKLGEYRDYIETLRGIGYRFREDVA